MKYIQLTEGPFPHNKGLVISQIMVVPDTWGKIVHLIPLPVRADAKFVAERFYSIVYCYHGAPRATILYRDPKFTSAFWKVLQKKVGTNL